MVQERWSRRANPGSWSKRAVEVQEELLPDMVEGRSYSGLLGAWLNREFLTRSAHNWGLARQDAKTSSASFEDIPTKRQSSFVGKGGITSGPGIPNFAR